MFAVRKPRLGFGVGSRGASAACGGAAGCGGAAAPRQGRPRGGGRRGEGCRCGTVHTEGCHRAQPVIRTRESLQGCGDRVVTGVQRGQELLVVRRRAPMARE